MPRFLLIIGFLLFAYWCSWAQDSDTTINWELMSMSLNDLVNIQVESASKEVSSLRNSPAIITVLTQDEIEQTGAQTLMELLSYIPGFDFSAEWDNIIGIGIRGNNATEGKYLIQIDGFELNETNFGSFSFNNHILLDNIKKIEVIRGPGSVIYGGVAELAVINIITKKGSYLKGNILASGMTSLSDKSFLNSNLQVVYGDQPNNDFNYKVAASYQNGNTSNQTLTTLDTTRINYADSSQIINGNIQLQMEYKKFKFNVIYDNYSTENTESYGKVDFDGIYSSLAYKFNLRKNIFVQPFVKYKRQKPWYFVNNSEKDFYNSINQKIQGGAEVHYNPTNKLGWICGYEYYSDFSRKENDTIFFSKNNKNRISFSNNAIYSELIYKSKLGHINLGIRYDYHSHAEGNFVPRIAYTKTFNRFHTKILYTNAYKSPTLYNIDYNLNIKPERTRVYEIEAGAMINDKLDFVVNVFDIKIDNPIIYIANEQAGADYYKNEDKTGSRGVEVSSKFIPSWGYFLFTYAFYTNSNNTVKEYEVESANNLYGAYPGHRANLIANFKINKQLLLGTAFKYNSVRYTYVHVNKQWSELQEMKYKPMLVVNAFIRYTTLNKLIFDVGCKNINNSKSSYLNAYKSGQNPIPGMGRTFYIKLALNINKNNYTK